MPELKPTSIAGSVLPLQAAEELVASLSDVVSARISSDASGAITAIHVLVGGATAPKQMVRNIESALMAQLGLRVDHRKISVAQQARAVGAVGAVAEVSAPAAPQKVPQSVPQMVPHIVPQIMPQLVVGRALYFEDVEIRGSRSKGMQCKVTLRRGEQHYVGEADGFESERSRVELAARASLAAVVESGKLSVPLVLEGARVVRFLDRDVVLVGVIARHGRDHTVLMGSCPVRDSAETSAALAVLDATNRWMDGVKG
ncbi:MAG: hypothetical protein WCL36_07315 [bacterium]